MEDEKGSTSNSTTASSSTTTTSPRSHPHPISIYSGGERHTVQVIQQALQRPSSSAAQYLQQMYAAQQQHIMLQTAALQQQHMGSSQLQSLAAIHQASLSGGKRSSSPTGTVTQQASTSPTSMNLSTSPTPAQLISRSQVSSTASSSITQQTMLLGSTSPTLTASQAQMYLRAQMLIFTPAVTVAAVHSDIPVSSSSLSSSCPSVAAQVQNVALHSQQLGALSCSQKSPPRICTQSHATAVSHKPTVTSSKVTQSDISVEINRKSPSQESRSTTVTHTSSLHQIIPSAPFVPVEAHSLVKQPHISSQSASSKGPRYQFVQQQHQHEQSQQLQSMQQQIQATTFQSPPLDSPKPAHCAALHCHTEAPISGSITSHQSSSVQTNSSSLTGSPTHPRSPQNSVVVSPPPSHSPSKSPSIIVHSQCFVPSACQHLQNSQKCTSNPEQQLPFPSHLPSAPPSLVHFGTTQQAKVVTSGQEIAPPLHEQHPTICSTPSLMSTAVPLSMSFPTSVQNMSLKSMQGELMKPEILSPRKVLVHNTLISEDELPAAEALVQLPFHTMQPPQTVAVNLQVKPSIAVEPPVVNQVNEAPGDEMPEADTEESLHVMRTPTPPTLSPQCVCRGNGDEVALEDNLAEQESVFKEASSVSASVIKSPSDSSYASLPPPPLLLPTGTTKNACTLMSYSTSSMEKRPPRAIVKPQILTHVIEGFVIQEGLEPFPVNTSSLLVKEPEKVRPLPEEQIMGITPAASEQQDGVKHPEISTDTDMEDTVADDGLEEMEPEILKCEFCGQIGYTNKFHRSKRFCSISCAKRYSANSAKRRGLLKGSKNSHWNRKQEKKLNQCVRRSSGSERAVGEYFLRQLPNTYPPVDDALLPSKEDSKPTAMTTRLRRQAERERELRGKRKRKIPERLDPPQQKQRSPSLWTVEEVWVFVHSLPGCHDIADEFRIQEIDGQALLLLKEDHLMSAMNIKLGPALKICAQINSLKEL
ncbi:polyhomeotic-like protein 3 [Pleurodeles waltl]